MWLRVSPWSYYNFYMASQQTKKRRESWFQILPRLITSYYINASIFSQLNALPFSQSMLLCVFLSHIIYNGQWQYVVISCPYHTQNDHQNI